MERPEAKFPRAVSHFRRLVWGAWGHRHFFACQGPSGLINRMVVIIVAITVMLGLLYYF